ncbi:MAG: acyl-CoA dehydrogenase family protein [Bacteroidota bacterium]|nr:acyl-CoA dehydrogenase family protein [Bacteroidota bacterium]
MENLNKTITGGQFLISESNAADIFIPEEYNEEQKLIADSCSDFVKKEILPILDRIDNQEEGLMVSLLDKAAGLGFMGIHVAGEYGGFDMNYVTSLLVTENMGTAHSFAVSFAANTGIGMTPIMYYGNEGQKKKYLPRIVSGELKTCYCLTEPGSGSDANSGRTKAVLSDDGKYYVLKGQKMWVTNGGFADVMIVFAKIEDDTTLSAFIVEKSFSGIQVMPEEHKMGIKGSSTVQIFFNDCKVPVENLLSERQQGFKIALNILNLGRIKLSAATTGAGKAAISNSVQYANERHQFGKSLSEFGAIKHKLAEQAIRIFAGESALYRTADYIEQAIGRHITSGKTEPEAILKATEQFAPEASILKVFSSETLNYVVDEGVQIYGGMGYSAEAPMDRAYRDSRINRIFEGTNEINRMVIVDMILKRALKGELDLMGPAMKIQSELMSVPAMDPEGDSLFAQEKRYIANFKKAVLMIAGMAAQRLMNKLADEQEILMNIADMIIDVFVSESLLLRLEKLVSQKGENENSEKTDMMRVFVNDAADRINKNGKEAINAFAGGDEQRMLLLGLKRFTKTEPFNAKEARRHIADKLIENNGYCF